MIGHDGEVVYRKAYGERSLIPAREPMTVDTIFDAASLTKVVATTSSVMKLFEQGKIRLDDPVTKYLPEFQDGHSPITIRNLMTHFSGLRPDVDLKPAWSGYETGIHRALIDKPAGPPGVRFVYSDINFILMGEIVHRLSGQMLSDFARANIFEPLGMKDSVFQPPASLRPRIAPTEIDPTTGRPLWGVVHDDTSRYMGGVAGHAGLFTTADDLAKFAQMLLDHGQANGARLFSPLTIEKFTTPESPADQPILRGLGWDIDSPYSSNRGDLFPIGSFGHTGFTGTSMWMDPVSRSYVILLTNVVHPHRGKSLSSLRSRVATIAAASFGITAPGVALTGYNETIVGPGLHRIVAPKDAVLTGLDVLVKDNFATAARETRRADYQPHRSQPRWKAQYRPDARRRDQDRKSFCARAWLARHRGSAECFKQQRLGQRPSGCQPVSGVPASPHSGNAKRRGCAGLRYSRCRRSILDLFLHTALQHGRSRQKTSAIFRS